MATSHGSPPPGTRHTDLSVENKEHKRTYPKPNPRSFKDPRGKGGGGGGQGVKDKQKAKKQQRQLEASHEGKTTCQWLECACKK